MGLATIDPHSQKEYAVIHKIPKFGVNQVTEIQRFKNVNKEMYGHPDVLSDSVRMTIHNLISL